MSVTLYRFFDEQGGLLYVGISADLPARWKGHAGDKPWWTEIARATVKHYPTRDQALSAELRAIHHEKPRYNIAGVIPGSQAWRPSLRGLANQLFQRQDAELVAAMRLSPDNESEAWLVELGARRRRLAEHHDAKWGESQFYLLGGLAPQPIPLENR